jgi:hypothetical protein
MKIRVRIKKEEIWIIIKIWEDLGVFKIMLIRVEKEKKY